jgi:hypothetical protein
MNLRKVSDTVIGIISVIILIVTKFNVYITVLRLNDKDAETLKKALEYSRKAYEEALAAKEASIRIENTINEFIKSLNNNNNESSNEESKGYYTKKKHYWYTVSIFIFLDQFVL